MSRSFYSPVGTIAGIVALFGTALTLATITCPVSADPVQPQTGSIAVQPSSLRVTGTAQQFTVEADHADIQKALKSLFDQANKQFDIDNTVAGQVTLRLTDQTFETILKSVCKQTFLRYHLDAATNIYRFERDPDAIKDSFTHLDSLNAELRQQLRALGLDLPDDAKLNHLPLSQNRAQAESTPTPPARGGQGGGRGSGQPGSSVQKDLQQANGTLGGGGTNVPTSAGSDTKQAPSKFKEGSLQVSPEIPMSDLMKLLGPNQQIIGQEPLPAIEESYLQFLRQNHLVAFYSNGVPYPMTDVLKELGRRANVPIMIDPSVPRGKQFRVNLNLPPNTLEDALNMILPPSRLRWFWIGSTLYIQPTANFQVFYGSAPQPYVIYGNSSNSQKAGQ